MSATEVRLWLHDLMCAGMSREDGCHNRADHAKHQADSARVLCKAETVAEAIEYVHAVTCPSHLTAGQLTDVCIQARHLETAADHPRIQQLLELLDLTGGPDDHAC